MLPPEPTLPTDNPSSAASWTPQEEWIWERTLKGEIADFNILYEEAEPLDPKQDDARWSAPDKPRLVSEIFLLDVLGRKPYPEAIPPRGLRIIGARFASDLDLRDLNVQRPLWLNHSRFEGAVNLVDARFDTILSFDSSVFNEVLNMFGLTVGRVLSLSRATFARRVDLGSAKVDGYLDASGATFQADLSMESLTVGQTLLLSGGARFAG
jgi:hypothetical protein